MAENQKQNSISILLELEQSIRRAVTIESLWFVMVNQLKNLISFDQALFFDVNDNGQQPKIKAISGEAVVDKTIPFVQWALRIAKNELKGPDQRKRHELSSENLTKRDIDDWNDFSPSNILWIPLIGPQKGFMGILWISRQTSWTEKEITLIDHISLSFAHGLQVFKNHARFSFIRKKIFKKPFAVTMLILIISAFFLPVKLSSLGSLEVVPTDPYVVTSPLDGVVEKIFVKSNQDVKKGEIVAKLDDTELKSNVSIFEKALEVARTQLENARRGAFVNQKSREFVSELEAKTKLRNAELKFVKEQLKKSLLKVDKNGVAIVSRPEEWSGRPVKVGEKILLIADPENVEIRIMLPVKDSILLSKGNEVLLFLDSSPLKPKKARIIRSEYAPVLTELNILSYVVTAELADDKNPPRIGLRGTAKVYGKKVNLFYYLFRRPITAVRQWIGW